MNMESRIKGLEQITGLDDSLPTPPEYLDVRVVGQDKEKSGEVIRVWIDFDRTEKQIRKGQQ